MSSSLEGAEVLRHLPVRWLLPAKDDSLAKCVVLPPNGPHSQLIVINALPQ